MLSLKADKGKVLPEVKLHVSGRGDEGRCADDEIGFTWDLVLKAEAENKETIRTTLTAQSCL